MPIEEFMDWQEYLDQEMDKPKRSDYMLAQIAAEVRRGLVKDPKKVSLKDFLHPVKFVRHIVKKEKPVSAKTQTQITKQFFGALCGKFEPKGKCDGV